MKKRIAYAMLAMMLVAILSACGQSSAESVSEITKPATEEKAASGQAAGDKVGEACVDMGGMKVILRVASHLENFDYDKFFRAYANTWMTR